MKITQRLIAIALLLAGSATALAEGDTQSFNMTNWVEASVTIRVAPTNVVAGKLTGTGVNVANYDRLGFFLYGDAGAAGTITLTLVRSPYAAKPTTGDGWETTSTLTLTVPSSGSGHIMWVTNLPPEFVRPANWIGVNMVTNNGGSMSNIVCGVVKKLIPAGSR